MGTRAVMSLLLLLIGGTRLTAAAGAERGATEQNKAQESPSEAPVGMNLTPVPTGFPCHLPEDSQLRAVAEDDGCYGSVAAEMAKALERCSRNGKVGLETWGPPWEIQGRAIASLFPNHRFFVFAWRPKIEEQLSPGATRPLGLAGGKTAVAIDPQGHMTTIDSFGDRAAYGEFLAQEGVKVRNAQEAKLVWDAFCEIDRRERAGRIERASHHVWRLGVTTFSWGKNQSGKRYFEVQLNPDLSVKSGRVEAQRPDGSLIGR